LLIAISAVGFFTEMLAKLDASLIALDSTKVMLASRCWWAPWTAHGRAQMWPLIQLAGEGTTDVTGTGFYADYRSQFSFPRWGSA
jgi:hypothetical protein